MFQELKILICGSLLLFLSHGPKRTVAIYSYSNDYYNPSGASFREGQKWVGGGWNNDLGCARIFEYPNYQGRSADFNGNDKQLDWGYSNSNFRPQSVKVKSTCSLTLYDYHWSKKSFVADSQWISGSYYPVLGACCECGGCDGQAAHTDLQCARLYEHDQCNGCAGFRLDLKSGDRVRSFGHLDNRMSSIAVRPGCYVIGYYNQNYLGYPVNFSKSMNLFGDNWNKNISSVECYCPQYSYPTTGPAITGWPDVTWPTEPTWPSETTPSYTWPPYSPETTPSYTWPTYSPETTPSYTWPPYSSETKPSYTWPTWTPETIPHAWNTWSAETIPHTWPDVTLPTEKPTMPSTEATTWYTKPTTKSPTVPTTVRTTTPWDYELKNTTPEDENPFPSSSEEDAKSKGKPLVESTNLEEDKDDNDDSDDGNDSFGMESEEVFPDEVSTTTTMKSTTKFTTTMKPTTTSTTTTKTTTEASKEDDEDNSDDDDKDSFETESEEMFPDEDSTTTTMKPTTLSTTTTTKPTTTSTTTTKKTTTTETTTEESSKEDDDWGKEEW